MQTYTATATKRNRLGFAQGRIAMARGYACLVDVSGWHRDSGGHCPPVVSLKSGRLQRQMPCSVLGS